jgi:hypothetical protein
MAYEDYDEEYELDGDDDDWDDEYEVDGDDDDWDDEEDWGESVEWHVDPDEHHSDSLLDRNLAGYYPEPTDLEIAANILKNAFKTDMYNYIHQVTTLDLHEAGDVVDKHQDLLNELCSKIAADIGVKKFNRFAKKKEKPDPWTRLDFLYGNSDETNPDDDIPF